MNVRQETAQDFDEIYHLVRTAFETAEVSDGREQDFVSSLRYSENYIPELALVAEEGRKIIGHIMLTRQRIVLNEKSINALLLAPVCVDIAFRRKKLGSRLIDTALEKAEKFGFDAVFLVGNPDFYNRFGFEETVAKNVKNLNGLPDRYVLVKELKKGCLDGCSGTIDFDYEF
ncbi:MAG: N-acetyltransferase [Alphaproteobacteria bacterium]|nr:N-acetyltransferase [Alphaproteobacteria bacterium]